MKYFYLSQDDENLKTLATVKYMYSGLATERQIVLLAYLHYIQTQSTELLF